MRMLNAQLGTWETELMSRQIIAAVMTAMTVLLFAPVAVDAQTRAAGGTTAQQPWTPERTTDGKPDLQGYWTTQTFTPLQRPEHLADKAFYTEEEAAELHAQLTAVGVDPLAGSAINIDDTEERSQRLYQDNRDPSYVHYDNSVWLRTDVPKGLSTRRTSLITDPPNGRIPPRTAAATARAAAASVARRQRGDFDGYHTRPLSERCYAWPHNGPPMLPPAYNDIHQIFQTPDNVVVFTELSNNAPRIISLAGGPTLPDGIRLFPGHSRGHWEGDTLVVESMNFNGRTRFQGATDSLQVVERFTRVDANTIRYEFTVDDPTTWTRPWSVEIPMIKTEGPMFEFACHEGNYDLRHILEIYRNIENQESQHP